MQVQLKEIWIYPVKSLPGIRLKEGNIRFKGLVHDRRWMLVNPQGIAITQREYPQLSQFQIERGDAHFIISWKGDSITLPIHAQLTQPLLATVWNDTVTVHEVSPALSAWFSEKLGMPCSLVFFPEANPRLIDPQYNSNHSHTSLSDGFSLLMIGTPSLNDLNQRLSNPVAMARFRPNLVVEGGGAFDEDTWGAFHLGETRLAAVKPCARCVMTTIDPATGIKGKEPLHTLAQYRNKNGKTYFGQNLLVLQEGTVREGDPLRFSPL